MNCPQCGQLRDNLATTCPNCGAAPVPPAIPLQAGGSDNVRIALGCVGAPVLLVVEVVIMVALIPHMNPLAFWGLQALILAGMIALYVIGVRHSTSGGARAVLIVTCIVTALCLGLLLMCAQALFSLNTTQ